MSKTEDAYKTIGEVVKILGLKNKNNKKLPTHTIRFWEKSFKQIKPKILSNNHRYYDKKDIDELDQALDQHMPFERITIELHSNNLFDLKIYYIF